MFGAGIIRIYGSAANNGVAELLLRRYSERRKRQCRNSEEKSSRRMQLWRPDKHSAIYRTLSHPSRTVTFHRRGLVGLLIISHPPPPPLFRGCATGSLTAAFYVSRRGIKRSPQFTPMYFRERARARARAVAVLQNARAVNRVSPSASINCSRFYAPVTTYAISSCGLQESKNSSPPRPLSLSLSLSHTLSSEIFSSKSRNKFSSGETKILNSGIWMISSGI